MNNSNFNLDQYANSFIKLSLKENKEIPYVHGDIIAYLRYDEGIKMYVLNHPYKEESGKCDSGEAAFSPSDIKDIRMANDEEKRLWATEYIKFHNDWIKAKGYDCCELDLSISEILGTIDLKMK